MVYNLLKMIFGLEVDERGITKYAILELYLKIHELTNKYKDNMKTATKISIN